MHSSLVNIQKVRIEAFVVTQTTQNFLVYFFLLFYISMVCCRPSYHPKQCELFETLKERHALIIHPPGCTHGNAVGSKCSISCEQNFIIPFYIPQVSICTKSGEWSPPIPKCRTEFKRQSERNQEHCKTLEILEEHNSMIQHPPGCTNDFIQGSICYFKCKQHFVTLDEHPELGFSTCKLNGEWDPPIPTCVPITVCSSPEFPYGVMFSGNCSMVEVATCSLTCINSLILYGPSEITCRSSRQWTEIPHCGCAIPQLSESQEIQSLCVPHVGKTCTIRCKDGFMMDGSPKITCRESGHWSELPKCFRSCPEPHLPSYLKLSGNCTRKEGYGCQVVCLENKTLEGSSTITCLSNSKWTEMPICINVGANNYTLSKNESGNNIMCPELTDYRLILQDNCTRHTGSQCYVSCIFGNLQGSPLITCASTGQWSFLPTCEDNAEANSSMGSPLVQCLSKGFPDGIRKIGSCSTYANTSCEVGCFRNNIFLWKHTIYCLPTGEWSEMKLCKPVTTPSDYIRCPELQISYNIILENCTKELEPTCFVSCPSNNILQGPDKITCLNSGNWTDLPICQAISTYTMQSNIYWDKRMQNSSCPQPILSEGMILQVDCSNIDGTACTINCNPDMFLNGPQEISCKNGTWSEFPKCEKKKSNITTSITNQIVSHTMCPEIALPYGITLLENCILLTGVTCPVHCESGMTIIGPEVINCLPTGKWSSMPSCIDFLDIASEGKNIEDVCPDPKLPPYLNILSKCKRLAGVKCSVGCQNNLYLNGSDTISCMSFGRWSSMPTCVEHLNETSGASCPRNPPGSLLFADDCNLQHGQNCQAYCQYGLVTEGAIKITCHNGEWINTPNCITLEESKTKHITCGDPQLSPFLHKLEACKTNAGLSCAVGCEENKSLIGPFVITCLPEGKWSSMPTCVGNENETLGASCPKNPPGSLLFADDCHLEHGQSCQAYCQYGLVTDGSIKITCHNGKWINTPNCITLEVSKTKHITCGDPQLPPFLHKLEVCKTNAGLSCAVGCEENKSLIGPFVITCLPEGKWSSMPTCVGNENETLGASCPKNPPGSLLFADDCHLEHGQSCQAYCQYGLVTDGSIKITCHNGKWINTPNCITLEVSKTKHITCGDPQLPPFLHKLEVCKTNAGLSCAVGCEENKSLIGPFVITCLPEGKWSSMPTCVGNENETLGASCPKNPPGSLLFADDCHLEHGQSCQAYCQYGLVTDGSIKITCHNGKWINTPNCITLEESKTKHITCGDPQLPPFLHKLEACKTNAGLSCAVGCEENKSLIGPFVITCLPEGKWSSMPTCVGNENETLGASCPKNPPGSLLFADDCHLEHGQSCQAYCQYGLVTDGSIKITCHNGKWINTPNCITLEESKTKHITCGDPQLPPFLHKLEACKTNAGLSCAVGCEENKSLIGPFVITCLPEGKWSSMPTCVGNENETSGASCPKNPPDSLLFADDCHLEHGQSCQAYCQYGLVTDGSIKITCHNGKWINTPNCITLEESKTKHITCGDPQLPPFLHKLEVCKTNAGLSCAVGCEESKSLIGPFVITCLPEGKWSSMPTCIEELNETSLVCAETLPHGLSYSDQCHNKDGQSCFVHCGNGLVLDGSSEIFCKNGKWSNMPKCVKLEESHNNNISCANPNLPEDVKLLENCKTLVGISCALSCHGNKLLEGPNSITCLYNGTWSSMPICVDMFYTSQNCPDNLPRGLAFADKCSKKDKSICQVYCEDEMLVEGSIAITCVMGKWTNMPKCINHEETSDTKVICPSPVLHPDVRFFEECKRISGASCALDCKDNLAMQGPVVITCLSDGKWSIAPNCVGTQQNAGKFCSDDLPDGLAFADKCSKRDKSICQVYCEDELLVEGSIAITCVMGKWTNMPKCINHEETSDTPVICPSPVLHPDVRFFEECKGISGASCALDCNDNLAMQGPVVITCLSDGKWSDAPNCINAQQSVVKFCPEELPHGLAYADYCSKINDHSCIVYCEDGLALRGSVEITCKNGEWKNIPQCIKPDSVSELQIVCPEPEFPSNVITLKECQKMEGISCFLGCRDNMSLKGPIVTTCLPDKKWSQMPICLNHRHLVSSSCPHILPNGIGFVNNCRNEEGESCQVYCENGLTDTDSITIACINGKWMNLPNCTKIRCEKPVPPNDLFLSKVCTDTAEGSVCYVDCQNNLTLEGNNMIKCLPIGKWSDFPKCVKMQIRDSCPKLQLHKGIEIIGNCDKTDGTVCHVTCVNGILEGPDVITCLAGSWSSSPSCAVHSTELNADFYASCLPPKLPNNIVPFGPCPILGKRTCDIGCIINGTVLWKEAIECLPSGIWTDLPSCTSVFSTPNILPTKCPILNLNYPLQVVNTDCNNKIGTVCFVTCQEGLSLNGPDSIMCLPSGNWSSYPTCVHFTDSSHEYVTPEQLIIGCQKPPPLPDGVVLLGPCSTIDNTVCKIGCIRNTQLLWSDSVFCLPSGTWSEVQHCPNVVSEITPKFSHIVCQDVQLSENLMFSGNCTEKTAGSRCQVVCKDPMLLTGNDSITCLVSGEWSEQPKCILSETIECEELELPLDVQTVGTCHKTVGSVCMLSCPSGMFLNGPKQVTCLSNKEWSEFPVCVTFHLNKGTRPKPSRSENDQDPIEDNCPLGYFYYSGQCYGLTPEVKGIDIQNLCHPPLHPLVIENQETYDFIVRVIRINKTVCLWTGISDTKEEGVWYDSRGNLAKFLPWDKGEPSEANTLRAKVQNCVVMTKWDGYMYHDYSCYTLSCNFMCQFPAFL